MHSGGAVLTDVFADSYSGVAAYALNAKNCACYEENVWVAERVRSF